MSVATIIVLSLTLGVSVAALIVQLSRSPRLFSPPPFSHLGIPFGPAVVEMFGHIKVGVIVVSDTPSLIKLAVPMPNGEPRHIYISPRSIFRLTPTSQEIVAAYGYDNEWALTNIERERRYDDEEADDADDNDETEDNIPF